MLFILSHSTPSQACPSEKPSIAESTSFCIQENEANKHNNEIYLLDQPSGHNFYLSFNFSFNWEKKTLFKFNELPHFSISPHPIPLPHKSNISSRTSLFIAFSWSFMACYILLQHFIAETRWNFLYSRLSFGESLNKWSAHFLPSDWHKTINNEHLLLARFALKHITENFPDEF